MKYDSNTTNIHRTIHGMVYNAMKLFMEINPQLFDDCSHDYNEQQNNAPARQALREKKWAAITEQANKRKANGTSASQTTDEPDSMTDDNQKRLDSLKLQDGDRRDRRPHERQSSIGSSRSQR